MTYSKKNEVLIIVDPTKIFFLMIVTTSSFMHTTNSANTTDQILLRVKQTLLRDPFGYLRGWRHSTKPCNWTGISCGGPNDNDVVSIDLTGLNISGEAFPADFCRIHTLRNLNLGDNNFVGNISPASITPCSGLVSLNLSNNHFAGALPDFLVRFPNLTTLDLSSNNFSGDIPRTISRLGGMKMLDLSGNRLSGIIPGDLGRILVLSNLNLSNNRLSGVIPLELTKLKLFAFDVSYNQLTGQMPEFFDSMSFYSGLVGNPGLCSIKLRCDFGLPPISHCSTPNHAHTNVYMLVGAVSGGVVLLIAMAVTILLVMIKTKILIRFGPKRTQTWKFTTFQKVALDEQDVLASLKAENLIGSGGSGCVYRVVLKSGHAVAAKKLRDVKGPGTEKAFRAEVETMGGIRHLNIVKLLFTCISEDYKILVYEYMENGSLGDVLHDPERGGAMLDWPKRFAIAMGTAQGLAYLHHDCVPAIMHRDLKSNNILLDEELKPKVADFGLAKTFMHNNNQSDVQVMSRVAGSYGYIAPECGYTLKITEKSDVYSFGILLLELMTGKRPNDSSFDENKNMVKWVKEVTLPSLRVRGRKREAPNISTMSKVLDCRMNAENIEYEEVNKVLNVALLCTVESPRRRPSMRKVVELLKKR